MWAKPADCPKLECPVCEEPSCPSCPECPSCDDDKPQPVTAVKPRTVPIPDEPAPAEEAQAPTTAAVVRIVGDSPDQWWLELNGRKVTGDTYPPGTYTLWAGLNGTAARNMGNLVVAEGQELVEIRCSASWGKCRAAR
ncbi:MAG: hypothetical protein JXX28_11925 [Deltaproteobacteria bacterium]|nr:hypothetical protein [Deltaproteobacteria bacterium]